jgi:hypothetical protein
MARKKKRGIGLLGIIALVLLVLLVIAYLQRHGVHIPGSGH